MEKKITDKSLNFPRILKNFAFFLEIWSDIFENSKQSIFHPLYNVQLKIQRTKNGSKCLNLKLQNYYF